MSEMEQFMVDGICSDMSQPRKQQQHQNDINQPLPSQYQHHLLLQQQQQQQYYHHHHHHLIHPYPLHHLPYFQQDEDFSIPTPPPPPEQQLVHQQMFLPLPAVHDFHYHHHPIPITHQLFQQTHQFHLLHQEQQRRQQNSHLDLHIDPQTPPVKSASPPRIGVGSSSCAGGGGIPAFLAPSMNFSLSVNEKSGAGCNDDAILQQSDEVDGSDSHWPPPTSSREDNHATIKQPFWRPLDLDTDYKEKNLHHHQQPELEENGIKQFRKTHEEPTEEAGSNYKLFSELEAICKTTGSSSALTGENPPPPTLAAGLSPVEDTRPEDGGDLHLSSSSKALKGRRRKKRRKRRRRRMKEQLNSIVSFFETLVKELVDRQEILHGKFFEVLEKRDSERMAMEALWREEEARNSTREAKAKEQEYAMAAAREGAILSFLEKISRENIINNHRPNEDEVENKNIRNNEEEEEDEEEVDDDKESEDNNDDEELTTDEKQQRQD